MAGGNTSHVGGAVNRHFALATFLADLKLQPSAIKVPDEQSKGAAQSSQTAKPGDAAADVSALSDKAKGVESKAADEKKEKKKLKISVSGDNGAGMAARVFNRRCETAAAASLLVNEVIAHLQAYPPGCAGSSSAQALDPAQTEAQRVQKKDFENRIHHAFCAMEEAGLLHDKKVLARIESAVTNLKRSIGLDAMPERKPSFFRGLFKTENDPEPIFEVLRQLDLAEGPVAAKSPVVAGVEGDVADAQPKPDGVSLASLQSVESALNAMITDSIPTLQTKYQNEKTFSHSAVLALLRAGKFDANFSKLSAFLGTRKMQKLTARLPENDPTNAGAAAVKANPVSAVSGSRKAPAVLANPMSGLYKTLMGKIDMQPPSSQIPAEPCNRNPSGKNFAFFKTEKLVSNQIRHGDPLGHLEPDFFVLKGRMLKCASRYEHEHLKGAVPGPTESYQHWRGAQVLLSRGSAMKEPIDQLADLIDGLQKLAQGQHDYAEYVINYLNTMDVDVLRWIVQNITTATSKAPATIPKFHSKDCRNLLEALFCEGSTQPHCIHFFQALQSAFLLAIPVPERNQAVDVFLGSCKAGIKFPRGAVEGKIQSALSAQWDVVCQARAEVEKGFLDAKTALQVTGALPVATGVKGTVYQAFHRQKDRFETVYGGLILATAYQLNNCRQSLAASTTTTVVDYTPANPPATAKPTDPRLLGLMESTKLDTALLQLHPKHDRSEDKTEDLNSLGRLRVALHEEFKELIRLVDGQAGLIRQMVSVRAEDAAAQLKREAQEAKLKKKRADQSVRVAGQNAHSELRGAHAIPVDDSDASGRRLRLANSTFFMLQEENSLDT